MSGIGFRQYNWNRLERGSTIVLELSARANVKLMDPSNFAAYTAGRNHHYRGGQVTKSPFPFVVPSTGTWYLTIDRMGMGQANVRSSVRVLPPPLPVAQPARITSISGVRAEPAMNLPPDETGQTWDVVISHASEDKAAVGLPLHDALTERGLKVWLDKGELRIGDSLRRKIDYGLAHSSFGIVVMSKSFFAKGWPQYELDGIVGLSVAGKQRMLPIWHEISKDEVERESPSLADKIARTTATSTIAEIAEEIAAVVRSSEAVA